MHSRHHDFTIKCTIRSIPLLFPLYISISSSAHFLMADEWDKWPLFAANTRGPDQSEAQQ